MTRRRLTGIISSFLLLIGVAWWASRPPVKKEVASAPPPGRPTLWQPEAPSRHATVEALPEFGSEAFNKLAKERGAAWMASRNRDAVSLLAMWDMTGDEAILREAAERFPGNRQVCLAMLGVIFDGGSGSEEEKRKWTDLLIAADPANPLGYHYQARLAQAAGDRAGALAALETALGKKDRINYYLRERMVGAREGLLASGVPLKDAYFLALAGPMAKVSAEISGTGKMVGLFKTELAAMKAAGRDAELQELASLGLRLAEQQRLTQSPTLITELMAQAMRMKFLKELDPETEIANSGRSVAQELVVGEQEQLAMRQFTQEINPAHEYLQTAPLEVRGQYADRMMLDGEMAAIKYLLEEMARRNP